ncbi:MAG: class I SAM-dependent methyltransferase [Thermoplasmata archaeon]
MNDARPSRATRRMMRRLFGGFTQTVVTQMVRLGYELGLWEQLAERPRTSLDLARAAGLDERPVREWLSAVACARLVRYDPERSRFSLSRPARDCLTGPSITNLAAGSQMATAALAAWPHILRGFRGGGVSYPAYAPAFPEAMAHLNRARYDALFVDRYLPLAPGLTTRLRRGASVLEVGCGDGHVTNLLARAFPRSRFVGIDAEALPLRWARREARTMGLTNVRFIQREIHRIPIRPLRDAVLALDMIHDLSDPTGGVTRLARSLRPGGWFVAVEPRVAGPLEANIGNTGAAYLYGISTLYCTMVARSAGGDALGAAWGPDRARALLARCGLTRIRSQEAPGNSLSMVLTARAPAARSGPARSV